MLRVLHFHWKFALYSFFSVVAVMDIKQRLIFFFYLSFKAYRSKKEVSKEVR